MDFPVGVFWVEDYTWRKIVFVHFLISFDILFSFIFFHSLFFFPPHRGIRAINMKCIYKKYEMYPRSHQDSDEIIYTPELKCTYSIATSRSGLLRCWGSGWGGQHDCDVSWRAEECCCYWVKWCYSNLSWCLLIHNHERHLVGTYSGKDNLWQHHPSASVCIVTVSVVTSGRGRQVLHQGACLCYYLGII